MSSRSHERRTERATAEEVAEVERQLWEFAKRIDPPSVPEAKLRPGAFLYRIHRTWHSLGRGTGGLASRSFRALRDELLKRDPPVRNLQPKLYGNTALSHAEAEQLIDVVLDTWELERGRNGKWHVRPLSRLEDSKSAESQDLETIRENLLHTLFRGDDHLVLEEPLGVPPEVFYEERGRTSEALIVPTKGETTANFSPANAYGGFSAGIKKFYESALEKISDNKPLPVVIWVLRLDTIRDNPEYHQSFHSLAIYAACLTNWFFRLQRHPDRDKQKLWKTILERSAFVVHGLPLWIANPNEDDDKLDEKTIDEDLLDLGPEFFVPYALPIVLKNHHQVKKHKGYDYGLNVSVEAGPPDLRPVDGRLRYWLFPDHPTSDVEETAETTGLPVFDAEISPGKDFDIAYSAIYEAASVKLQLLSDYRSRLSYNTLRQMGWQILTIEEFQHTLLVSGQIDT